MVELVQKMQLHPQEKSNGMVPCGVVVLCASYKTNVISVTIVIV